jgi:plastocyanin
MKTSTWVWIVAIIVVLGGGYWYWSSNQAPAHMSGSEAGIANDHDTNDASTTPVAMTATDAQNAPMSATVAYTNSGFSPAQVTIKAGGAVTFVDQSTIGMYVASNPHPLHSGYDGTTRSQHCAPGATPSFDQCTEGKTYTFTFEKVGSWGYHNHVNADDGGVVNVVQ